MWRSFFSVIFLLVGIAQAGDLGVRVTYSQSLSTSNDLAVKAAETTALNSTIFANNTNNANTAYNLGRNLRGDRQLCTTCACLCQGFAPKACYLVYRGCPGWRRSLAEEEPAGHFVFRNLAVNQASCNAMKQTVTTSLGALATGATLRCFEVN